MVQNNFCSTCTICDMGQPPHPSGQVTFACHLPRDKFCKKYLSDPAVDPGDYHFLGFQVDGYFYFHSAFPFGLRSATLACQRTTQSVVYILNTMEILVDVYIDDFYGACKPSQSHSAFHRMNT